MNNKQYNSFINLAKWLGQIPSIVYALVYLILIPLFALIYWYLPNHFYHSTITYEQYMKQDASEILGKLKESIVFSFEKKHEARKINIDGWNFDVTTTRTYDLKEDNGEYNFTLWCKFEREDGYRAVLLKLSFFIEDRFLARENAPYQTFFLFLEEKQEIPIKLDNLFPFHSEYTRGGGVTTFRKEYGFLVVSNDFEGLLKGYSDGMRGFPSASSGSFSRMFYLSAIIITTVGFGDIVPISPIARILVSTEAILGIVLIGLFLNALAYEIRA